MRAVHSLERSGGGSPAVDWLVGPTGTTGGIAFLRARLTTSAFSRHRHDTYTIAVTEQGIQEFTYRGTVHRSLPGQVVILHPDEVHDGRPASESGFTFRSVYIEPSLVSEAVSELTGRGPALPFAQVPVVTDPLLASRIRDTTDTQADPLEEVDLLEAVCAGLLRHGTAARWASRRRGLSDAAFARARALLDEDFRRHIGADELESLCGESRFNIAEEFRRRQGTSPHRYLLMRRLSFVRARLAMGMPLAALALEAGFADQSHMSRHFKATFGLTPAAYARLSSSARQARVLRLMDE
jgi:AraC-like DNA-binding protein